MTDVTVEAVWKAYGERLLAVAERSKRTLAETDCTAFAAVIEALAAADAQKSSCAELPSSVTSEMLDAWEAAGLLVSYTGAEDPLKLADAPLVADTVRGGFVYQLRRFEEEAELGRLLARAAQYVTPEAKLAPALKTAFQATDTTLWQKHNACATAERTALWREGAGHQYEAVENALKRRLSVITGGPGTGKTSTVVRLLTALLARNGALTVALVAPTGKAAGRLKESLQKECLREPGLYALVDKGVKEKRITAQTIHRLLSTPNTSGVRPGPQAPVEADVLIADEASMIDVSLALKLMRSVDPAKTRLIFLGDKYQLAAVGPGSVFADMTASGGALSEAVTELTYSFRFGADSPVGNLSRAVNTGDEATVRTLLAHDKKFDASYTDDQNEEISLSLPKRFKFGVNEDLRQWIRLEMKPYLELVKKRTKKIAGREESDKLNDEMLAAFNAFRVLCAQRRGPDSVSAVNRLVEEHVKNTAGAETDAVFYPGRIIIVRVNDQQTELYNGDVGIVVPNPQDCTDGTFWVYFGEGKYVPAALLPGHETAYALTIHQSQGSQFERVAVVLPVSGDSELITRELVYTGITRAVKKAAVFANIEVLKKAVASPVRRMSGLGARLKEATLP